MTRNTKDRNFVYKSVQRLHDDSGMAVSLRGLSLWFRTSSAIALAFQPIANIQVSHTNFPRATAGELVFGTQLYY